jgi:hypothetical protein
MKNHKSLYFFAIIVLISSCRARFYTPSRNPVPLFKEKGDLYFDGSTNLFNKLDFTAGAAVSDNIAGYIGYGYSGQSIGGDSAGIDKYIYRGNMLNIGAGYFLNESQSQTFRFEIFGDYAIGTFNNKVTDANSHFFNGNFNRIGIMPNIGYRSSDNLFSACYSIRASQIRFYNAKINDVSFWQKDVDRYNSKYAYTILEHALNFRFGGEKLKFQFQITAFQGLNADELVNAVPKFNMSFNLGAVFELNALK